MKTNKKVKSGRHLWETVQHHVYARSLAELFDRRKWTDSYGATMVLSEKMLNWMKRRKEMFGLLWILLIDVAFFLLHLYDLAGAFANGNQNQEFTDYSLSLIFGTVAVSLGVLIYYNWNVQKALAADIDWQTVRDFESALTKWNELYQRDDSAVGWPRVFDPTNLTSHLWKVARKAVSKLAVQPDVVSSVEALREETTHKTDWKAVMRLAVDLIFLLRIFDPEKKIVVAFGDAITEDDVRAFYEKFYAEAKAEKKEDKGQPASVS